MKTKAFTLLVIIGFAAQGFGQNADSIKNVPTNSNWKIFSEVDLGILFSTGGYANYFGLRKGAHSFEMGYHHFPAPNSFFSGKPEEFDLTIEHIYSIHYSYFWNGKTDKGFFTRFMYHNKMQIVTEKSSGISKKLNSDLLGMEIGYVWYVYKGFYLTPRLGALYYIKSPQGRSNKPVQIGNSLYDNDRHKIWDTYFIPTLSIGYSLSI